MEHVSFDSAGARVLTTSADGTARVWESATGKRSKNQDFIEVIKELEGLPPERVHAQHLAMANALRIYRNLTAHPSEFEDAKAYAPGLVQLACATLTGMKE